MFDDVGNLLEIGSKLIQVGLVGATQVLLLLAGCIVRDGSGIWLANKGFELN